MNTNHFPSDARSVGRKVEYLSRTLMPQGKFREYVELMAEVLAEDVHYIDPVHEMHGRSEVLKMLAKYVPRAANDGFQFQLITDTDTDVVWRWTIRLKIRFSPFQFIINGLVHAKVQDGRVVYQREYYDPMESIGVIPLFGWMYKLILRMG